MGAKVIILGRFLISKFQQGLTYSAVLYQQRMHGNFNIMLKQAVNQGLTRQISVISADVTGISPVCQVSMTLAHSTTITGQPT